MLNLRRFCLGLDNVVNDGIQKYSRNAYAATEQLHEIKRFSKDKSHTNNNNDTLGGVGDTLSDGILKEEEEEGKKMDVSTERHQSNTSKQTN